MKEKIAIFASDKIELSPEILRSLEQISNLKDVVKVVSLPDVHYKKKMEVASSTAVAVKDNIIFSLSSPSQNCGMALAKTDLEASRVDGDFTDRLFDLLRETLPLRRTVPEIDRCQLKDIVLKGARWATENYQLDFDLLNSMEEKGCVFKEDEAEPEYIFRLIPDDVWEAALRGFPHIGEGNHFLEMQTVDEVCHKVACDRLGIRKGQILFMYHTGSGRMGYHLGRFFANRKKMTPRERFYYFRKKTKYHFSDCPGLKQKFARWKFYFTSVPFVPIPASSKEGYRAMLSIKISANCGYANRMGVLAKLRDCLVKARRCKTDIGLVCDSSHNSIREEQIGARKVVMHRHNAVRVPPLKEISDHPVFGSLGYPALIPGTNRTFSYLCLALENGESLNSIDHAAGAFINTLNGKYGIDALSHRGRSDYYTRIYKYGNRRPNEVPHISSEGIEGMMRTLRHYSMVIPVARLRPIAVLKGQGHE